MENQILVVEDSRPFRRALEVELRKAGYTPVFADSILQTQQILDADPDSQYLCAVLDYCLPDGQDGEIIDLCLSMDIKVIVLTGLMDDITREKVLAKPVIDYIPKDNPSCISALLPVLNRLQENVNHKALIVDDSATVRRYLRTLLERQYLQVVEARNGLDALEAIDRDPNISLVISDYEMPEMDGIALVRELRKTHSAGKLAIIGLSGSNASALTARFLKAGANDFLTKPFNQEEFYCRVHCTLNILDSERQLFRMANQDYLTQCWNRRYFFEQSIVKQGRQPINVSILDVDHFKHINDTYGHHVGDMVLTNLANHLKTHFHNALVARFGGEEFCIVSDAPSDAFLSQLEAFKNLIEYQSLSILNKEIHYTVSIGVVYQQGNIHELLAKADENLYEAKTSGRNRIIHS